MKNLMTKPIFLAILSALCFCYVSCGKDNNTQPIVKGCTNREAINYNPDAQQNDGSCCVPQERKYYRSGNVFEAGYTVPFASFSFEQVATSFSASCGPNKYTTTLKIQNLTGHNLSFSYDIQFRLNAIYWTSANNVTLVPGQVLEVGEINQNPGRIDLGLFIIPCYNIRVY